MVKTRRIENSSWFIWRQKLEESNRKTNTSTPPPSPDQINHFYQTLDRILFYWILQQLWPNRNFERIEPTSELNWFGMACGNTLTNRNQNRADTKWSESNERKSSSRIQLWNEKRSEIHTMVFVVVAVINYYYYIN